MTTIAVGAAAWTAARARTVAARNGPAFASNSRLSQNGECDIATTPTMVPTTGTVMDGMAGALTARVGLPPVGVAVHDMDSIRKVFDRFALRVAGWTGSPWAFGSALTVLVLWALSGPVFGFSNTWQLIINTSTTIVTFMMVFVIQHSENKNSRAVQMKLDELISVTAAASNRLIDIENLGDDELDALQARFAELSKLAERASAQRSNS